jgi:hypothetical protein
MKYIVTVALAALIVLSVMSYAIPTALAYPPAVNGFSGSVSGKVLSQDNVPVDNAYVSIVNASDPSQVYANTTTDSGGNFQFNNVNGTYDLLSNTSTDGRGGIIYKIYASKAQYGSSYTPPFGLAVNDNSLKVNGIIQTTLTNISISADMLSSIMKDDRCARIIATVYDSAGQPAPDGTIVDFTMDEPGWTTKNGSLNKEGRQSTTATTSGGKAYVNYGWFPASATPANNTITVNVHYFTGNKASMDLYFPAAIIETATPTPTPTPLATVTPEPSVQQTPTPAPTKTPTITPTITNTVEPSDEPGFPISALTIVIYIFVGAVVIAQVIALFYGLKLLKKKK